MGPMRLLFLLGLCAFAASAEGGGRESYSIACTRCHGDDGSSEDYAGVKRLDGIGRRLKPEQIRERMNPVPLGKDKWSVRSHVFTEAELHQLVDYVASLPPAGGEAAR